MKQTRKKTRTGVTLIELAIVLAILGLLIGGLFKLYAEHNKQVQDQITAQQLQLYVKATRAYVSSNFAALGAAWTGTAVDVTAAVQAFRAGTLSLQDTNGNTYAVYGRQVSASPLVLGIAIYSEGDGREFTQARTGAIASYVGAEGGSVIDAPLAADNATTTLCNETGLVIMGSYGGYCVNAADYGASTDDRPAAVLFVSEYDYAIDTTDYLARVDVVDTLNEKNTMRADLNLGAGIDLVGSTTSGITMPAGANITLNGATAAANTLSMGAWALNMGGGDITAGGGDISMGSGAGTGGGIIEMEGGQIYMGDSGGAAGGDLNMDGGDLNGVGNLIASGDGSFTGDVTANAFVYTSDMRLKHDVKTLSNALDDVRRLRGVSFLWNKDNRPSVGVIAQNMEAVYPDLVREAHDGTKTVEMGNLVGPLIEAVKTLSAEVDRLKAEVKVLQNNATVQAGGGK